MVTHLEVGRIHTQREGMQLAQGEKAVRDIIYFLNSIHIACHDSQSMLTDSGRPGAHVFPVGEVGLRLGKDEEGPENKWREKYVNT